MDEWELVILELGERVATEAARSDILRVRVMALAQHRERQRQVTLLTKVTPKGANVSQEEIRRRRAAKKRARKAKRRNRD